MTLRLDAVTVRCGLKPLIDQVSAVIPAATVTVVVGRNGAGKSTLLRALSGVSRPDAGRVLWTGSRAEQDFYALSEHARAQVTAWVPSAAPVPFDFTVLDLVVIGRFARHGGRPSRDDRCAAEAALATVGAASLARRGVTTLSTGELARVSVARGLAAETPVLILDEPTANLDVAAALALLETLRMLATAGRTVVLSQHDLTAAWRFADHALCLANGRLVAAGPPKTVLTPAVLAEAFHVKATLARTDGGVETLIFDR